MIGLKREFAGWQDCLKIQLLAEKTPTTSIHVLDMPYRLSGPTLDDPRSVGLWEDEAGELIAFAVIQWPWQTLDYAYSTEFAGIGIEQQILDWAIETFPKLSRDYLSYEHPLLFIDVPQNDAVKASLLSRSGFNKHDWQTTHFEKSLDLAVPRPMLPPGFSIRNIASAAEYVEIHRAAFDSTTMSMRWREWVEKWPSYRPEFNIVAVAPGGKVAAFCSGWIGRESRDKLHQKYPWGFTGQIEPMGVHPDYRKQGLGRVVLEEVFRRMRAYGIKVVIVETDNFREAAQGLYRAVGFEQKYLIYKYCREF
jgi:ribosomal protein S18 acetylase RimI-like enzyme